MLFLWIELTAPCVSHECLGLAPAKPGPAERKTGGATNEAAGAASGTASWEHSIAKPWRLEAEAEAGGTTVTATGKGDDNGVLQPLLVRVTPDLSGAINGDKACGLGCKEFGGSASAREGTGLSYGMKCSSNCALPHFLQNLESNCKVAPHAQGVGASTLMLSGAFGPIPSAMGCKGGSSKPTSELAACSLHACVPGEGCMATRAWLESSSAGAVASDWSCSTKASAESGGEEKDASGHCAVSMQSEDGWWMAWMSENAGISCVAVWGAAGGGCVESASGGTLAATSGETGGSR